MRTRLMSYIPSLRSGKIGGDSGMTKQKSAFLLVIPLGLHYLCKHE